jgi:hypothetical protein
MYNFKQIRLNVDRMVFLSFGFYYHNDKYMNGVLVTLISMNLLILGWHLLHILDKNLSTTPSNTLLFVYMFSFLAYVRPKYHTLSVYSYYCVRRPYPKTDGKGRKVSIVITFGRYNIFHFHCFIVSSILRFTPCILFLFSFLLKDFIFFWLFLLYDPRQLYHTK